MIINFLNEARLNGNAGKMKYAGMELLWLGILQYDKIRPILPHALNTESSNVELVLP